MKAAGNASNEKIALNQAECAAVAALGIIADKKQAAVPRNFVDALNDFHLGGLRMAGNDDISGLWWPLCVGAGINEQLVAWFEARPH